MTEISLRPGKRKLQPESYAGDLHFSGSRPGMTSTSKSGRFGETVEKPEDFNGAVQ